MRIVLDTNVIVAAFASRGLCAEVFEVCISGHSLVISEHMLAEIESAFQRKIKLPKPLIQNVVEYLRDMAEVVEPDYIESSVCRDKNDLPVIGTASRGKAAFIITGDTDLLSLKNYEEIEIISPRDLWNRLR